MKYILIAMLVVAPQAQAQSVYSVDIEVVGGIDLTETQGTIDEMKVDAQKLNRFHTAHGEVIFEEGQSAPVSGTCDVPSGDQGFYDSRAINCDLQLGHYVLTLIIEQDQTGTVTLTHPNSLGPPFSVSNITIK